MQKLSAVVREFVAAEGACASGVATVETLSGGPPSADLAYVLPGARAAVSFAVPIDAGTIPAYLRKTDRLAYEKAYIRANAVASGIALHLAVYLSQKGYPSVPLAANNVFRPLSEGRLPGYTADLYHPDIAHRYLAAASGVGHLGFSGNLITASHGAAVVLGGMVTAAGLCPTAPLPADESYCDRCRLCVAACVSGFMDAGRETRVSLGGHTAAYSQRRDLGRCDCVCSGFTGLHASGRWSTWSPGRFAIPEDAGALPAAYERMRRAHAGWPESPGGRYFFYLDEKLRVSCANCQLVCAPDRKEREARHRMLTTSGVVIQRPDGGLVAVPPEEADRWYRSMPAKRRALYLDG